MTLESVVASDVEVLDLETSPTANWIRDEWHAAGDDPLVQDLGARMAQTAHGLDGILELLINDECNREDASTSPGIVYNPLSTKVRFRLHAAARALSAKLDDDLDTLRRRLER